MNSQHQRLLDRRAAAVPKAPFHVTNRFVARAQGAKIWDIEGREYIDFAGGIGCVNAGHNPPEVVEAICRQAQSFLHTCFHVMMYEPYVELAEKINGLISGDFTKRTIFFNSGAEAVENAIKTARCATRRPAVVCFDNGFHGRTLMAMSLTSKVMPYKSGFGPFAPEVYRVPHPYFITEACPCKAWDWHHFFKNTVAADQVAAILVEPELGEGGFVPMPSRAMTELRRVCDEFGIVLIADEVQSGFCRTGKMFAMEHYGVAADLTVLGKSIASGMPLSAVCGRADLLDKVHVGGLGGTYSGNPVCCAAGLATLKVYQEKQLWERANLIGNRVRTFFEKMKTQKGGIGDVRGLGAMIGVEFVRDGKPDPDRLKLVQSKSLDRGLILMGAGTYGNVLRTLMPLVISDDELNKALSILEEVLE